ncbi:hypothetical protein C3V36_08640 [Lachnospiraceae bacterium oral taxon 500]|nr:hypothetical protein C3V36_08640 [Lachnospiraceae bacterium oral taxon 500]
MPRNLPCRKASPFCAGAQPAKQNAIGVLQTANIEALRASANNASDLLSGIPSEKAKLFGEHN